MRTSAKKHLLVWTCAAAATLLLMVLFGFFGTMDTTARLKALSDSTAIPAVLILSFTALSFISRSGIFDIFGYSARYITSALVPSRAPKIQTYHDYKMSLADRPEKSRVPLFLCGLVLLGISATSAILYYFS